MVHPRCNRIETACDRLHPTTQILYPLHYQWTCRHRVKCRGAYLVHGPCCRPYPSIHVMTLVRVLDTSRIYRAIIPYWPMTIRHAVGRDGPRSRSYSIFSHGRGHLGHPTPVCPGSTNAGEDLNHKPKFRPALIRTSSPVIGSPVVGTGLLTSRSASPQHCRRCHPISTCRYSYRLRIVSMVLDVDGIRVIMHTLARPVWRSKSASLRGPGKECL
ncbi:hypothetical protein ARMGADRAFT_754442 [Armillaria gallica]|uniref:Uncharacterized protein n=1 Tax=Armillaria gallica TaxID=47427 RepID=A0A2H3DWY1_ARMGA|nr:hypothetical protein ARMGADRAFT_754442 [Armillaria gallica]